MPKTKRDLLIAIADRIGGERAKRMREALRDLSFAHLLDRPLSDEEFAAMLRQAEKDLPSIMANLEPVPTPPGTWGFPN